MAGLLCGSDLARAKSVEAIVAGIRTTRWRLSGVSLGSEAAAASFGGKLTLAPSSVAGHPDRQAGQRDRRELGGNKQSGCPASPVRGRDKQNDERQLSSHQ